MFILTYIANFLVQFILALEMLLYLKSLSLDFDITLEKEISFHCYSRILIRGVWKYLIEFRQLQNFSFSDFSLADKWELSYIPGESSMLIWHFYFNLKNRTILPLTCRLQIFGLSPRDLYFSFCFVVLLCIYSLLFFTQRSNNNNSHPPNLS